MPRPQMILRSSALLRRLMEGRYTCNSLGPAIDRSRQLIAHLAYGRRTSCSTETAVRLAAALGVEVGVLFVPGSSDESPNDGK